jgi:hypothetical protein
MWVFGCRASHLICKDYGNLWTFKKLSLSIVIKRGDNNPVTTMYSGFLDVIQSSHVEALYRWTFRPSTPLVNQLDLGGHMTKFLNRSYSITLHNHCSLAGNLINWMYIMVPMNTLLSLTTKNETCRQRDSSPTIEGTFGSLKAHIAAETKSTRNSLEISESRIWHQHVAHIHWTTMKSLIHGYSHTDSTYTVCFQAQLKQRFTTVPDK